MDSDHPRPENNISTQRRKRAKYTAVAWVDTRFDTVHHQIETLRKEVEVLSARLRKVEKVTPVSSPKAVTSSAGAGLHRILNAPNSPSYIGPTSAEFGLSQPYKHLSHESDVETELGVDEDDRDLNQSTAAQSLPPARKVGTLETDDSLRHLGLEEVLRLLQVYEDTVGIMYPCVDLASVRAYSAEFFHSTTSSSGQSASAVPTLSDQDWFHARDIQVLSILLATALLVESHGRSELAARLADNVEDRFASRLKIAQVDMKEILILTLLSIFHSYRDDEVIAWRLTGMAARGSMELGLHCQETWEKAGGVFPGALELMWASRLFWCIYVLDRKWSFGTGLPFAIQDSDMDTNLPEPGHSSPYLTCMISYARLGTKIWGLVVGWPNRSREAISEGCALLDAQVQQWVRSIPRELRFDPNWRSPAGSEQTDRVMMLQVLLALQANQLRILVYRQNLLSSERIAEDPSGASVAVETAKSTIHMLDYFSRVSNIYFQRPEPFNYFLISALAALFLAVLHAPARYSHTCRPEFYSAIDMVRRSATRARTSRRLQKIIYSLKRIQLNVRWRNEQGAQSPTKRHRAPKRIADSRRNPGVPSKPPLPPSLAAGSLWGATPLSSSTESPPNQGMPGLYHPSDINTPQTSSGISWPRSPGTAVEAESNGCEDLSSFFEIAGGLYFDPGADAELTTGVDFGMSHLENGRMSGVLDAFQASDEALTRVMAGLL
ncbi:hypothetical protein N7462_002199 [Penicillium macrosclerotiorum]|uniref:uncharacterized protein n=1 Tax=Penicillium macrosclerotiorum TaxID=303699 RepID=UPI0025498891|nr:uncharacterized protein N7462_002199 [Penicillium macrosclerotiorum]KAJ5692776.1 hypothetical protein N7462_002199 [Penicillium macrosclerotiorum]